MLYLHLLPICFFFRLAILRVHSHGMVTIDLQCYEEDNVAQLDNVGDSNRIKYLYTYCICHAQQALWCCMLCYVMCLSGHAYSLKTSFYGSPPFLSLVCPAAFKCTGKESKGSLKWQYYKD